MLRKAPSGQPDPWGLEGTSAGQAVRPLAREEAPSAPSCSAATASSIDCSSVSAAERVCDCGEGVQCPKDRNPIFFMGAR